MSRRVPVSVWLRKVERALSDKECEGAYRVVRLPAHWLSGDDADDAEEITNLDGIDRQEGVYLLQELDAEGDAIKTVTECRVGRRGERLGSAPDPLAAGARSMNLLTEGWANLVNSQGNTLAKQAERIAQLEKERDSWRDQFHDLVMKQADEPENGLYDVLQTAVAAYMAHDTKEATKKFCQNKLLARLTPEQQKMLLPVINEALSNQQTEDMKLVLAAHVSKKEDEPS